MLVRRLARSIQAARNCQRIARQESGDDDDRRVPTTQETIDNVKAIERVLPAAEALRELPDDDQLREVFGSGLVRNVREKVYILTYMYAINTSLRVAAVTRRHAKRARYHVAHA